VPEDGQFLGGSEVGTGKGVSDTTLEISEDGTLFTPEKSPTVTDLPSGEIPVPEQPPGSTTGEIGIPELRTSVFAQQQRQQRRRQREQDRGGVFGEQGADRTELDEILRGPEGGVMLGEETPPSEQVAEQTGREFFLERDTDPRVIVPEETAAQQPRELSQEATEPLVDQATETLPRSETRPLSSPLSDVTIGPDTDTTQVVELSQQERVAEELELAEPTQLRQPTETRVADPIGAALETPPAFEFGNPGVEEPPVEPAFVNTGSTGRQTEPFDLELGGRSKRKKDDLLLGAEQRYKFETRDLF
jgi:hypothetical protein